MQDGPGAEQKSYPKVSIARQVAVYGTGAFSNSMANVVGVVLPLWALQLNPSPFMLGLILASRHFLPFLFSIHGGALMDRLGTRRVMIVMAIFGTALPLLYPVSPVLWAILLLQMLTGFANAMTWVGAQSSISQLLHGSPVYASRFAFSLRVGLFAGPPLVGWAWDMLGPWGGFAFISLWASGVLVSALVMGVPDDHQQRPAEPVKLRALLPRLSDYVSTFKLLALPGMGVVVAVSAVRIGNVSIQDTFFVVLLGEKGLSATEIGLLISVASIAGAVMTFFAGAASKYVSPYWIMLLCVITAVASIAVSPLIGSFAVFAIAAAIRGGAMGLSQPLVFTVLADAVGKDAVGKGFGLRMTANRFASATVPLIMGAVAGVVGLATAFYIMGGVLGVLMIVIAIQLQRTVRLRT